MTEDREQEKARQLLSAWRGAVVPVGESPEQDQGRQARVLAIQKMIAAAPAKRAVERRRRWAALLMAAGFVALIGVGAVLEWRGRDAEVASNVAPAVEVQGRLGFVRGRVIATSGGVSRVVDAGELPAVHVGDELSTAADASVVLEFKAGARVDLSAATTVKVEHAREHDHVIAIGAGRVDVNVPEASRAPQSFVVSTPNAKVVVHGTIFSVEVVQAPGAPPASRVQVTRGLVSVESAGKRVMVRPGESWHSGAKEALGAAEEPKALEEAASAVEGNPRSADKGRAGVVAVNAPSGPKSTLAEENRIFETGLAARERGDFAAAERHFEDLLARFPRSQVVQAARIQLQAARNGQRGDTRGR